MTVTLTYDATLSRVRVTATGLDVTAVTAVVERSTTGVAWTTVRGGGGVAVAAGALALPVDDYEFAADAANTYRVTAYDAGEVQTDQEAEEITPPLGGVWLKSVARPYLNRQVTILDYSDVERPARGGVFDVIGRSYPVAVTDVRGSRRWRLDVLTPTAAEASDVDLLAASGDILLVHVPADCGVPGGYVSVGDTVVRRTQRTSARRIHMWPVTEVAVPGPDVVGATVTWQGVLNAYATWADVLAAHATWADVLELIGSPSDVIVP